MNANTYHGTPITRVKKVVRKFNGVGSSVFDGTKVRRGQVLSKKET